MHALVFSATFALAAGVLGFGPRALARVPRGVVVLGAAASGVAAAIAPSAPTGWEPLDHLLCGVFGAAAVLAGAARPGGAMWAAGVTAATLLLGASPVESLGWVAAGSAAALLATGARAPVVGGLAAGLSAQVLLRLEWPVVNGASLLAGVVAAVPLLALGWSRLPRRARRPIALTGAAAAGVVIVGAVGGLAAAMSARADIDRGVDLAREGLDALGSDDREAAAAALAEASDRFDDARARMQAWWARPAGAVPLVSQHTRAVSTLAQSGADLGAAAAEAVGRTDPGELSQAGGAIDLDAIRDLVEPLAAASAALDDAESALDAVSSPWLLPPVSDRLSDLHRRVAEAAAGARNAAEGARLAPALLGGDGPRRYFLAIQNPAEARAGGGFMGSWGELTAVEGRLVLTRLGRVADLTNGGPDPEDRVLRDVDEYVARYGDLHPERYWGLVNFSNDFPTVAAVIAQLYPQSGGEEIDGVISVDPIGFAALLELTGPVAVAGWPEPLTSDNAIGILLHEQYLGLEDDEARVDFLAESADAVFTELTSNALPGPGAFTEALGPAVAGRHLQLASVHADEQRLFEQLGAAGAVPSPRVDSVGFVGQNYGGNKIDWFLRRSATYDLTWDPGSGQIQGSLTISIRNEAPASGLPHSVIGWGGDVSLGQIPVADGENLQLLTVYSAVPFTSATLDGEPLALTKEREFGRFAYTAYVRVPASSTSVVRAELAGSIDSGGVYRLDPLWQPVVNADELSVQVTVADGWELTRVDGADRVDARRAEAGWVLDRQRSATLVAERRWDGIFGRLRRD